MLICIFLLAIAVYKDYKIRNEVEETEIFEDNLTFATEINQNSSFISIEPYDLEVMIDCGNINQTFIISSVDSCLIDFDIPEEEADQ